MTDFQLDMVRNRISQNGTFRRDLARYYNNTQEFKDAYAELLSNGHIYEEGTGRRNDPCVVFLGQPPEIPDWSKTPNWVTKVPRPAWAEFIANCVMQSVEPEDILTSLLTEAIKSPNISQSDAENA